jgi:hypothetical protein
MSPAALTGCCRDYKGKEAERLVTRIEPGVVLLVAELRGHERLAAEELGQWKTGIEERKPLDASPAITGQCASRQCRGRRRATANGWRDRLPTAFWLRTAVDSR